MTDVTAETQELLKKSWTQDMRKAGYTQTSLPNFDLQRPAKLIYPVNTPLRNAVPRVQGDGDTATRWRTITALNSTNLLPGVSEGNRAAVQSDTINNVTSPYYTLGRESFVTWEGDLSSMGFDDARARSTEGALRGLMISEEQALVGGNSNLALGTTPTPVLSVVSAASSLVNQTYSVICVALTLDGVRLAGGFAQPVAALATVKQQVTQASAGPFSNSDVHNAGAAQKSASATQAITGNTQTLKATVTAVQGAAGYAWYIGLAGSEVLTAITAVNVASFTVAGASSQTAASLTATDFSKDGFVFDGLMSLIAQNNTSSYIKSLDGAKLTSDGAGNVTEILTAFQSFWDNFQLGPTDVWCNSAQYNQITKYVVAGGGTPVYRINVENGQNLNVDGGVVVKSLTNPFTISGGEAVRVHNHPYVPAGTILFTSSKIPYQFTNVGAPLEVKYRRDYYALEWPMMRRTYDFGVYTDQTLAMYVPFAFGMINNILAG